MCNDPPMPIIPDSAASEAGTVGNYLVSVLNKRQSDQLYLLIGLWLIGAIAFYV